LGVVIYSYYLFVLFVLKMKSLAIIFGISTLLLALISTSYGHSYVTTPITRGNQRQSQSGCRGPDCLGPCDKPLASKTFTVATIARGSNILLNWPRNNHAGGFVRYAWAPTAQSDAMSVFDTNVQLYTCFEIGSNCGPSDPTQPNGGDAGGQYCCGYNLTAPGWLTDGDWTLQWAWFGGAFSLGDYYSCLDYTISGGPTSTETAAVFIGGDYADPGQQVCKFWNTDKLHECIDEPCNNVILPGQNTGPVANVEIASTSAVNTGTGTISGSQTGTGSSTATPSPPPPPSPTPSPPSLSSSSSSSFSSSGNGGNVGSESSAATLVACTANAQCKSGVCQMNGFCYSSPSKLDAGGIAALFFAFLFIIIVLAAVLFVYVNKTEWNNWRPFKK